MASSGGISELRSLSTYNPNSLVERSGLGFAAQPTSHHTINTQGSYPRFPAQPTSHHTINTQGSYPGFAAQPTSRRTIDTQGSSITEPYLPYPAYDERHPTPFSPNQSGYYDIQGHGSKQSPEDPKRVEYDTVYYKLGEETKVFHDNSNQEPVVNNTINTPIVIYTAAEVDSGAEATATLPTKNSIRRIRDSVMVVWEPELVNAIRQIVPYYPSEAIANAASVGCISTRKPYHMLQHYRDDLRTFRESWKPTNPFKPTQQVASASRKPGEHSQAPLSAGSQLPNGSSSANGEDNVDLEAFNIRARRPIPSQLKCTWMLQAQLKMLEDILDRAHKKEIDKEKMCHQNGKASFDMLWYLFPAGSFAYAKVNNRWTGCVVILPVREQVENSVYQRSGGWMITCWYLGFDGEKIRRIETAIPIPAYNGAREITSLPIYPVKFGENRSLLNQLVKRGKLYYDLVKAKHPQMQYRGELLGETRALYNGRVIVDPRTATMTSSGPSHPYHLYRETDFMTRYDDNRGDGILGKKFMWEDFLEIDPQETPGLTNRHYFLLPREIRGFALQRRKWETLDIECISECPDDPDQLEKLILGEDQKYIIKSLSQSAQASNNGKVDKSKMVQGLDLKDGRREGRIFLLHGPSGVGKSFTAECVARSTGRPLLSLTCAEIGTDETQNVESNLGKYFMLARGWDAIIVIDEADVYVEGRGVDLKRGNLVAAFLRALETFRSEYHGGIIFLTTNRLLRIDPAVRSRVHIPIYYPPLDEDSRKKIYKQCAADLQKQGFNIPESSTFFKEMEAMKWNGREINNSLHTIAALAEYGRSVDESLEENKVIDINVTHIQPVIEQLRGFKAYFDESKTGEAELAMDQIERKDNFIDENRRRQDLAVLEKQREEVRARAQEIEARVQEIEAKIQKLT